MSPRLRLLAWIPVALLAACTEGTQGGASRCTAGEAAPCACADGATGARTCGVDGRFGACACEAAPVLELGGTPDPEGLADRLVDLGAVPVDTSVETTIPVRNAGGGTLTLSLSSVNRPFTLPGAPQTLGAGEEGTLRLGFSPATVGDARTTVTVSSDGGTATVRLVGLAFTAAASCAPGELGLGTVVVGVPAPFELVCTNGSAAPWPATVAVDGLDAPAVAVALADPLPGADGAWRLAGTLTATRPGAHAARIVLGTGADEVVTVPVVATAVAQALEVPGHLDLGFVPPGIVLVRPISLRNHGPTPVRITRAVLAPDSDDQFDFTPAGPLEVPPATGGVPGETLLSLELAARHDRLGHRATGTLVLELDGDPEPRTVALTAFVGGPVIACSPAALDFGEVGVGFPTVMPVVCTNVGTDDPLRTDDTLLVSAVTSSDPAFTAAPALPLRAEGYGVGESFTVDVTLDADAAGPVDGTVLVHSNAINAVVQPHPVPVQGTGVALEPCDHELVPPVLDFGLVDTGREATLEFAIRNRGAGACQVRHVALAPGCDPSFSLPEGEVPTAFLPAGAELRVPVRFQPLAYAGDPFACAVRLEVSHPTAPTVLVPVSGTSRVPCLELVPRDLDFGPVAPGCGSGARTVQLVNACVGGVQVTGIELAPGPSAEFGLAALPTLPAVLGTGGSLSFELDYRPSAEGVDRGGVFVTADGVPYLLPVRGGGHLEPIRTDAFEQHGRPRVDALFVTDNDVTLAEERELLAARVAGLLSYAEERAIDFQLGVTSAAIGESWCYGVRVGGVDGRLLPVDGTRARIVTPATPDRDPVFAENLRVSACGIPNRPLEAALRAVTPPLSLIQDDWRHDEPDDGNLGFLRDGAHLSIVVMTAKEDYSPLSAPQYLAGFQAVKGAANPHLFSFHAIAGDRNTGCYSPGQPVEAGNRMIDLVDATGGSFHSICSSDWDALARDLSAAVFGHETCFAIGTEPDPGQGGVLDDGDLAVEVNGQAVPPVGPEGRRNWSYRPAGRAICFDPLATPEPGARLSVTYRTACLGLEPT